MSPTAPTASEPASAVFTTAPSAAADARFPVQLTWKERRHWPGCPLSIPWASIAPFEAQAQRNYNHQTLEHLALGGGLHPVEVWAVTHNTAWTGYRDPCTMTEAVAFLIALTNTAGAAEEGGATSGREP
jgi:hypothetical protein